MVAHAAGDSAGQGTNDHECHSLPRGVDLLGAGAGSVGQSAAAETLDGGDSINISDCVFCVERVGSDAGNGMVLVVGLAWHDGTQAVMRRRLKVERRSGE